MSNGHTLQTAGPVIVEANYFLRLFLIEPWHTIHRILTWLVATSIVLASHLPQ